MLIFYRKQFLTNLRADFYEASDNEQQFRVGVTKCNTVYNLICTICNAYNVAERVRQMSIRFSLFVHTHNVLSLSWD